MKAIKEKAGLIIAQDPDEAGYDGMPHSAIATGAVDLGCPVAKIGQALMEHKRGMAPRAGGASPPDPQPNGLPEIPQPGGLPEIIDLLRTRTGHDFKPYKPGTLQRRVERRMALAPLGSDGMGQYATKLRSDPGELDCLAKDLLIHVTNFFRDPEVFDVLAKTVMADLIRGAPNRQLRI